MVKKCKKGFIKKRNKCVSKKKYEFSEKYVNEYQSRSFSNPSIMKTHVLSDTPFVDGIRTYNTREEARKDFNKTRAKSKKIGIHLEKHKIKKYKEAVKQFY